MDYIRDDVGYHAVHTRLRDRRGLASAHQCECGEPAVDWAHITCDDTRLGESGGYMLRYCTHLDHYRPMCRKCHIQMDRDEHPRVMTEKWHDQIVAAGRSSAEKRRQKTECKRGHPLSGENLYVKPDGNRGCKRCRYLANRKRRS